MGIEVRWVDTQQTAMIYNFLDPWTWQDYYTTTTQGRTMLASVNHKVIILINLSETRSIPPGALSHLRRAVSHSHPNRGLVILIGLRSFVQAVANLMNRIYPKIAAQVRFVTTLEEAYAIIEKEGVS